MLGLRNRASLMVEFPGIFVAAGALAGAGGTVLFNGSAIIADYLRSRSFPKLIRAPKPRRDTAKATNPSAFPAKVKSGMRKARPAAISAGDQVEDDHQSKPVHAFSSVPVRWQRLHYVCLLEGRARLSVRA